MCANAKKIAQSMGDASHSTEDVGHWEPIGISASPESKGSHSASALRLAETEATVLEVRNITYIYLLHMRWCALEVSPIVVAVPGSQAEEGREQGGTRRRERRMVRRGTGGTRKGVRRLAGRTGALL